MSRRLKTNKNENPLKRLEQISECPLWRSYPDQVFFTKLCVIKPEQEIEKLVMHEVCDEDKIKRAGLVYVLVVDGRIFKIGQTITPFKKRLDSYNTGQMKYRSRGTNSGANFFVLQSLLSLNKRIQVYAFFPEHKEWRLFDESGHEAFPSAKVAEKILIRRYEEKYGKKPLGCSQG